MNETATGKNEEPEPLAEHEEEDSFGHPTFDNAEDHFQYWKELIHEFATVAYQNGVNMAVVFATNDPIKNEATWNYTVRGDGFTGLGLIELMREHHRGNML
jgi:hypothetical protein